MSWRKWLVRENADDNCMTVAAAWTRRGAIRKAKKHVREHPGVKLRVALEDYAEPGTDSAISGALTFCAFLAFAGLIVLVPVGIALGLTESFLGNSPVLHNVLLVLMYTWIASLLVSLVGYGWFSISGSRGRFLPGFLGASVGVAGIALAVDRILPFPPVGVDRTVWVLVLTVLAVVGIVFATSRAKVF